MIPERMISLLHRFKKMILKITTDRDSVQHYSDNEYSLISKNYDHYKKYNDISNFLTGHILFLDIYLYGYIQWLIHSRQIYFTLISVIPIFLIKEVMYSQSIPIPTYY